MNHIFEIIPQFFLLDILGKAILIFLNAIKFFFENLPNNHNNKPHNKEDVLILRTFKKLKKSNKNIYSEKYFNFLSKPSLI